MTAAAERTPPHDVESERAVIGSMLLSDDAAVAVSDLLAPDDFFVPSHRAAYECLIGLMAEGKGRDVITLRDALAAKGFDGVDVHSMANAVPTSANVRDYAAIVRRCSTLRRLIDVGTRIATIGYETADGADSAVAEAQTMLFEATLGRGQKRARSMHEVVGDRAATLGKPFRYVRLPFFPDTAVSPGNLIVVGGKRGTGKTAFALHLLGEGWAGARARVAFYSYEMNEYELADRMIVRHSSATMEDLVRGIPECAVPAVIDQLSGIKDLRLTVKESAGLAQAQLFSSLRSFAAGGGTVAIIDYLQLAADYSRHGRTYDVTKFTNELKRVANDTGLIVVALSQFHRVDDSKVEMPNLSWFRESGSIENDANVAILLYAMPDPFKVADSRKTLDKMVKRFNLDFDADRWQAGGGEPRFVVVDFAKVRQGKPFSRPFTFDAAKMEWRPIPRVGEATYEEL